MTGEGFMMGEGAGSSELAAEAVRRVARAWTRLGPPTRLTAAFLEYTGATGELDLLEGLRNDRYEIDAAAAPLVFQVAQAGDAVALDLVAWAGRELGSLANAVIRQLEFERLAFDVVLLGSMHDGSPLLRTTLEETVRAVAPEARFVRLNAPPVTGAVILAMETIGVTVSAAVHDNLRQAGKRLEREKKVERRE